jgi:hypothetical protein
MEWENKNTLLISAPRAPSHALDGSAWLPSPWSPLGPLRVIKRLTVRVTCAAGFLRNRTTLRDLQMKSK